jgi:GH35 family endo-1,4-beta-xylanase
MIEAALESGVADCFTTWGVSDKNSYWNAWGTWHPCFWDDDNNAKPNYYAVQQTLSKNITLVNDVFLPSITR